MKSTTASVIRVTAAVLIGSFVALFLWAKIGNLVAANSASDDAGRVSAIIRSVALEAATADRMYQQAMTEVDSVRGGKALYLAAEQIAKHAETIDYNVINLARIVEQRCPEVQNQAARAELEQGVRGIYEINKTRHGFLSEIAGGMNSGDAGRIEASSEKYAEALSKLFSVGLKSMGHLAAAKQAVDLPIELTEFK